MKDYCLKNRVKCSACDGMGHRVERGYHSLLECSLCGGSGWRKVSRWLQFICWFSKYVCDIHDYPVSCGGDGDIMHFHAGAVGTEHFATPSYLYVCWACGKEFRV